MTGLVVQWIIVGALVVGAVLYFVRRYRRKGNLCDGCDLKDICTKKRPDGKC